MSSQTIYKMLNSKDNNADRISILISEDPSFLPVLIDGLRSSAATVKFKSAKVLRILSENHPDILYPHFDFFMNLTQDKNKIIKWNAIDIIAGLSTIDHSDKFLSAFDSYYGLLEARELITAAHIVENSDKIARARPELQDQITRELLKVEWVPLPTEECRNILAGKTIEALGKCFNQIGNKEKVVAFVRKQLASTRNATRKKAEDFLKKNKIASK